MIFKSLVNKFAQLDDSVEEKIHTALTISKHFNADVCKELSTEEVQNALQAILLTAAISQGGNPALALVLSRTLSEAFCESMSMLSKELDKGE